MSAKREGEDADKAPVAVARQDGSPFPLILSSPSGAGKTTIAKALLSARQDVGYSVSCTTRAPRPGEVEGKDYYFLSRAEFQLRLEQGQFAESAEVHGNQYGTLISEIERVLSQGRHVVMDVDIQGAALLRRAFPSVVTIFVLPPSGNVLLGRLKGRGSESKAAIIRRLQSALTELRAVNEYQYVVVNDSLDEAVRRVSAIVDAEGARRERFAGLREELLALVQRVEEEIETQSS